LADIYVCHVLLYPDFAVFDVEVHGGVVDTLHFLPAYSHELVSITFCIKKQFILNVTIILG
jgi:hypothetical protein